MLTDRQLEARFPAIEWREPLLVQIERGPRRWCCRYCLAQRGLKAVEVTWVGFRTIGEFHAHVEFHHSPKVSEEGEGSGQVRQDENPSVL